MRKNFCFCACKKVKRRAFEAYDVIAVIAAEFGVDLSKHDHLKKNLRMYISDETLNHMRTPGLKCS